MSLRQRLQASPETLGDLVIAAERRFEDGEVLLAHGRHDGAVYMLGLAAEMWLKLAALKLNGSLTTDRARDAFGPIRKRTQTYAPAVATESYHSLHFWATFIVRRRIEIGRPLSRSLTGQLRHHVSRRLFDDWKIEVRYSALLVESDRSRRVHADTLWLRSAWQPLWR